jgi:HPt (histidine-containing phosphotransfer) domain-containing protein
MLNMDYSAYLPHMNAAEGIKRVMNNQKLYLRLVGKFNAVEMADNISERVEAGEHDAAVSLCHALRGAAANLEFPEISKVAGEVEALAKAGECSKHLLPSLKDAATGLAEAIAKFTEAAS